MCSYDGSPFANKIDCVLAMRGIPHCEVNVSSHWTSAHVVYLAYGGFQVSMTLPRPEITDLLGIAYRRIPLLAIGNDVYCDTSLIVPKLEERVSPSVRFPSVYPPRKDSDKVDLGIIKAFAMTYTDRTLFPLGASLLPYGKLGDAFLKDRSAVSHPYCIYSAISSGVAFTCTNSIVVARWANPHRLTRGSATVSKECAFFSLGMYFIQVILLTPAFYRSGFLQHLLEEQLKDGREWLFDTSRPGYGDLSAHFFWGWMLKFRGMKDVMSPSKFPYTTKVFFTRETNLWGRN